jgi:hypothetical protein
MVDTKGLEANTDKTKCMVMPRDQNTGQSHNKRTDNSAFERVEQFKYLEITLTDQNSIQEEIKGRLKSVTARCYSVQNVLSVSLLPKTLKTKTNRTVTWSVVLYGCETWSLTLREEHRLKLFENRVLRRNLGLRGTR